MLGVCSAVGPGESGCAARVGEGSVCMVSGRTRIPVGVSPARWGWRMHLSAAARPSDPTARRECPLLVRRSWTLPSPLHPAVILLGGPPVKASSL